MERRTQAHVLQALWATPKDAATVVQAEAAIFLKRICYGYSQGSQDPKEGIGHSLGVGWVLGTQKEKLVKAWYREELDMMLFDH